MTDLPDGFQQLASRSTHNQGEDEVGIRIYKGGVLRLSKPLQECLPKDRYPRLVVGANPVTREMYIGPAYNGNSGTYTNSQQINADAVRAQVEALEFQHGASLFIWLCSSYYQPLSGAPA